MTGAPPEESPRWKGGPIIRKCEHCGKEYKVKKANVNKSRFCSRSCASSVTSRGEKAKRVERKCKQCGTMFRILECHVLRQDKNQGQFCSQSCRAIHSISHQQKANTKIEQILEAWLAENGIRFKAQMAVEDICVPDFFVFPNICVFADGDYWHSLPDVRARDKRQTKELLASGYSVIRLLGSKIKKGSRPYELLQNH